MCLAAPPPVAAQTTDPPWTNAVNVAASASTLTKNAGCDQCPDAGATSVRRLDGDGYAEFVPASGHRITAGLSSDMSASTSVATMDFAFSLWPGGAYEVRERGVYRREGALAPGDRVRVGVEAGVVVYRHNGVPIYTSTLAPAYPLALDVTLSSVGASLSGFSVEAARTAITWADPVKVIAAPGALTKSGGCAGCPDAGAHSTALVDAGGYAEFVPAGGHCVTAGLSTDLSAATGVTSMNYAFSLSPNGSWEIRELGVYRREGSFVPGDRFRVAIEDGRVVYRLNDALLYTSATAPPGAMTFDVTLSSLGASLENAATGRAAAGTQPVPPVPTEPPPVPPAPPAPLPIGIVTHGDYTAIVDRLSRAEPALPALGPAGSFFADPVFLSRVARITDGLTRPGKPGRSFRTPSSPHQNSWSATGSKFYVMSGDGSVLPYAFDADTGSAHRDPANDDG